jgi:solute carrier family 25 (mitochondrial 2-oxodicarboxylate transporter), member 21
LPSTIPEWKIQHKYRLFGSKKKKKNLDEKMSTGQSPMKSLAPITAASVVTAVTMYPVDVMRALGMASATGQKETLGSFIRTHGMAGLFKQGVGPEVGRATVMRVMKFFNFPIAHRLITGGLEPEHGTSGSRALAGALAVIPEVALITPIELAKIGLQLDSGGRFKNSGSALLNHVKQVRGVWGTYSGYLGVQLRQSAWTGTYFATLPLFQSASGPAVRRVEESLGVDEGSMAGVAKFAAGFGAGVSGAIVNTPIDVVRTNCQKNDLKLLIEAPKAGAVAHYRLTPAHVASGFTSFASMGARIVAEKGIGALYMGMVPKAAHLGGGGALLAWLIPKFASLMYD